jgi:hypothetical protein
LDHEAAVGEERFGGLEVTDNDVDVVDGLKHWLFELPESVPWTKPESSVLYEKRFAIS